MFTLSSPYSDDYDVLLLAALSSQCDRCEEIIDRFRRHNDFQSLEFDLKSPAYRKYVNACAMRQALMYYIDLFTLQLSLRNEV